MSSHSFYRRFNTSVFAILALVALLIASIQSAAAASTLKYNINTLAGKVASLNGTAGLQIRFSAFIEEEAAREQEEAEE